MGGVSVNREEPALFVGVGTLRPPRSWGALNLNYGTMNHTTNTAAHAAPIHSPATAEPSLHTLLRRVGILDNPALRAMTYDHNDIYGRGNGGDYMDGDILIIDTSPVTSIINGGEYVLRALHFAGMNIGGGAVFLVCADQGEDYSVKWMIQKEHAAFFSEMQASHPMAIVGRVVWVLQNVGVCQQSEETLPLLH